MGFLKRVLGGGGDKAPDWASFMSGEEYRAFEAAVRADFEHRGVAIRIEDDGVFVEGDEDGRVFGLFNLAQLCHARQRTDWPNLIREHFASVDANLDLADAPMDLETARPLLRVRLFRVADTQPEMLAFIAKRDLAPDLVAALALDLPTSVRTCNDDDVQHWGIPFDEAFAIAIANLADDVRSYARERLDVGDGIHLEVMYGDTFFVPSQVCRFPDIVGELEHGALVALPNRHMLAWHPLTTAAGAVKSVQGLLNLAAGNYADGPGSLTPDLYWWRHGTLTLLPSVVDRKGVQFYPPDEFVTTLNSLP